MTWRRVTQKLSKPFSNLTKLERFLQALRVGSACLAIFFSLMVLVGPAVNNRLYMTRINCAHLDVSYGLYNSLRSSVSLAPTIFGDNDSKNQPMGNSLTNSEIKLLSDYAEAQVAGAPQYCTSSLWSWCYGNYESYQTVDKSGREVTKTRNEVLTCSKRRDYAFDYRSQLEEMGLQSILAYAYQSQVSKSTQYSESVASRNHRSSLAMNGIVFSCCAQLMLLASALIIYANRGLERDLSKIPNVVLHALAVLSLIACLSSIISSSLITNLVIITRNEVASKLKDFGVSFSRGYTWFTLLWLTTVCCIITMASWALPLWCANPPPEPKYKTDDSILIGKYTQYF
ncbi:uncharacterized protein LODBEIA_P30710 [Lodderomyces beijingensis]|uniref:Uncharacterized protein n=1 Tax=Lodderomyces beijingensis TaxID=1775926 RepID=A0ABP0ZL22_9ASCO